MAMKVTTVNESH